MSELHRKLYATLFGRVDKVMEYINKEMVIPGVYDQAHVVEVLTRLQAAAEECEDMYIAAEEEAAASEAQD